MNGMNNGDSRCPMRMKDNEFAYASAYMRTLENKMLKVSDFEALLNSPSLEYALRILLDKGYGGYEKGQLTDAGALLREELVYTWNEIKQACPKNTPIDILLYQNDFHNLKTILKAIFSSSAYESLMLEPCTVLPDVIYRLVTEGKIKQLPEILRGPASEAYDILARDNDGQLAEIRLDVALFNQMKEAARQSKNKFLIDWVDLNIAIMNMKIALRGVYSGKSTDFLRDCMPQCARISADELARASSKGTDAVLQVFVQSGFDEAAVLAPQSFSAFEKWCDNERIRYARDAGKKLFGFETVFGFFIGKQFEIQTVRIILTGIRSGIPAGLLRERLREVYA